MVLLGRQCTRQTFLLGSVKKEANDVGIAFEILEENALMPMGHRKLHAVMERQCTSLLGPQGQKVGAGVEITRQLKC